MSILVIHTLNSFSEPSRHKIRGGEIREMEIFKENRGKRQIREREQREREREREREIETKRDKERQT